MLGRDCYVDLDNGDVYAADENGVLEELAVAEKIIAVEIPQDKLQKFAIVAYDKDNDYYGYLATDAIADNLMGGLVKYKAMVAKDELRRQRDGEPYDDVFIEDTESLARIA